MNRENIQSTLFRRGKSIVARILPGLDLIEGIEEICRQHDICNASVVSAIGTLEYATVVYVVPEKKARIGVTYVPPRRIEGPLELLAAQGAVGRNLEKQLSVHLHGLVSLPDMSVRGGHFVKGANPVLATAEVHLLEGIGVDMQREPDFETGFELFKFYPDPSQ